MRKTTASVAALTALCACLLSVSGCGGNSADVTDIQGVWEVSGTGVTVVYTDTQFKTAAATFEYELNTSDSTITYTFDSSTGTSSYEFSEDRQTLTLTEDDGNGGTKTTTLEKVSDDTTAEPGVEGATGGESE